MASKQMIDGVAHQPFDGHATDLSVDTPPLGVLTITTIVVIVLFMGRGEFERRMRALGWKRIGVVAAGPATFVKWVKGERVIYAPNHDIINRHTAHKLLGEAEG